MGSAALKETGSFLEPWTVQTAKEEKYNNNDNNNNNIIIIIINCYYYYHYYNHNNNNNNNEMSQLLTNPVFQYVVFFTVLCSYNSGIIFNTKQSGLTTSQFIVAAMLSRHVVVDLTLNVDGYKRTSGVREITELPSLTQKVCR